MLQLSRRCLHAVCSRRARCCFGSRWRSERGGGAARGDRHTREMRVTRVCTSSVVCGQLMLMLMLMLMLLLLLMPEGPAVCDGDGNGNSTPESNGVYPSIRTYVSTIKISSLCTSTSHTSHTSHTHASRRLPPGLSHTRVHHARPPRRHPSDRKQ